MVVCSVAAAQRGGSEGGEGFGICQCIVRPCSHVRRSYLGYHLSIGTIYKFARRHVAVRLSQGNVARRSLAPWMLVLLSNPGAPWQPAATTSGVSIRTVALICLRYPVSSRRAPRVCLASALRAYVRVAPARSARTIISVPMLIATKSSFLQLGNQGGMFDERHAGLRGPLGLKGWALGRLRLKRLKTGLGRF